MWFCDGNKPELNWIFVCFFLWKTLVRSFYLKSCTTCCYLKIKKRFLNKISLRKTNTKSKIEKIYNFLWNFLYKTFFVQVLTLYFCRSSKNIGGAAEPQHHSRAATLSKTLDFACIFDLMMIQFLMRLHALLHTLCFRLAYIYKTALTNAFSLLYLA